MGKKRFKSYEGEKPVDKHVRLTHEMLMHPKFQKLSSGAKVLYMYMKDWAGGQDKVTYSQSMAVDFMNFKAYYRARDELVDKGFIYWKNKPQSTNSKYPAEFVFIDTWHSNRLRDIPE